MLQLAHVVSPGSRSALADGPTSALADGSAAGAIPSAATHFVLAPFVTHEPSGDVQGGLPFEASVGDHATLRPAAEVTLATCCGPTM